MPPRQKIAAPVDRPLSKAYLREFSGWSTEFPPGISDPASLRVMENVFITREGASRVRPGMRYLSYATPPVGETPGVPVDVPVLGSHEPFFLHDGSKAYLFAVREEDGTVGFRALADTGDGLKVQELDAAGLDFEVPADGSLNFSAATTYVKYLQIDNKIFALSNAGEAMRLFYVGERKAAKPLYGITRPAWDVDDKLTVVQPNADWLTSGVATITRTNLVPNPSFETNINEWSYDANTAYTRVTSPVRNGSYALRIESKPERTNLCPNPLPSPVTLGDTAGWGLGSNAYGLEVTGTNYLAAYAVGPVGTIGFINGPWMGVQEGVTYKIEMDMFRAGAVNIGVLVRFFAANGAMLQQSLLDYPGFFEGRVSATATAPAGAVTMQIYPCGEVRSNNTNTSFGIRKVVVCPANEPGAYFDGNSGTNYFWTGTPFASPSVYHPPKDIVIASQRMATAAGEDYVGSMYVRAGSTARDATLSLVWFSYSDVLTTVASATPAEVGSSDWTRLEVTDEAADPWLRLHLRIEDVARGEYFYVDSVMAEADTTAGSYFDGSTTSTSTELNRWTGTAHASASTQATLDSPADVPSAETPTGNTLISSTAADNDYNFGFFYTFSNEVGETAASQITVVRTQRPWAMWRWETANNSGEPSGTPTPDPLLCADQLVAIMPSAVFNQAIDQGAIRWSLYVFTWSDQDPMPVMAIKAAERELSSDAVYGAEGWLRITPQQVAFNSDSMVLPNATNRVNYSEPSRGGQGLVAADRMVVVFDPTDQAVIRWSSNLQGSYTDFSATRGGGFKTLTSGNLFVPACVKLWQNPQSVDTITVLCTGSDGYSTGYYMAPAQVATQSETTTIMAFEETTATPGTVSPYGCEVLNNALYHPLDEFLMKSTANNYNINHATLTDPIRDQWVALVNKHRIVSSQLDNRLYYLVHNPHGAVLEDGCWGNEIWVFDAAAKNGHWSRWLIQGQSLRKFQQGDQVVMSVVRPDGIFYLDETYFVDDHIEEVGGVPTVVQRNIPWRLETNTQGANKAHDAWCRLQQLELQVGMFLGQMRYGIRSHDVHGKHIELSKVLRDAGEASDTAWDLKDYLLVRRDLREWRFFAESVDDEETGETLFSRGQINLIQYRYVPTTVNVGYEYGSIETFEYGRAGNDANSRNADNGVPMPFIDTTRP